jgi:hypothetical protein
MGSCTAKSTAEHGTANNKKYNGFNQNCFSGGWGRGQDEAGCCSPLTYAHQLHHLEDAASPLHAC